MRAPRTKTRVFSIAGETHSAPEVAECARGLIPSAEVVLEKGRLVFACDFDLTHTREELGYSNRLSFEDGVRATINAVRRQRGLPVI